MNLGVYDLQMETPLIDVLVKTVLLNGLYSVQRTTMVLKHNLNDTVIEKILMTPFIDTCSTLTGGV